MAALILIIYRVRRMNEYKTEKKTHRVMRLESSFCLGFGCLALLVVKSSFQLGWELRWKTKLPVAIRAIVLSEIRSLHCITHIRMDWTVS